MSEKQLTRNQKRGIIEVNPISGTRDFYPEDLKLRDWLFGKFRSIARSLCFQVFFHIL